MAKDYNELSTKILELVGGKENIAVAQHCATRLRINVKDRSKVQKEAVEDISGVVGTQWSGDQFQIIIGQTVSEVYASFAKVASLEIIATVDENLDSKKEKLTLNSIIQYISGSILETLPGMLAGGFINVMLAILSTAHLINTEGTTYQILYIASQAFMVFVPIMVANSAAKRLKTNPYMAMAIAAVLVSPDLSALFSAGGAVTLFGLPVTATTYTSSIFPILMIVPIMKYVYAFFDKYVPSVVKLFIQPFLTMLVMLPISLVAIGPLGGLLGNGLAAIITYLYQNFGGITMAVLLLIYPFIVMTGMHYALIPVMMSFFAVYYYDPLIMSMMLLGNIAQGSAVFGVAKKTKDSKLRELCIGVGIPCIFSGIIEPAMYGVNLKYKTPMLAACIGGAVSGLVGGLLGLKMFGGYASIFGIVGFFGPDGGINNFTIGCICVAIVLVLPFILVQFLYKDNAKEAAIK